MQRIRVLMFGWEFPPMNDGGLGVACYGLTKALAQNNIEILLVLPRHPGREYNFLKLIPVHVQPIFIDSPVMEYATPASYQSELRLVERHAPRGSVYGKNLFAEVLRYTELAKSIAQKYDFDIIHAHDWMTYQAGMAAKEISKKPLVIHVHATEYDRTGGHGKNSYVYDIEKRAMHAADAIIPVSNYTKRKIIEEYQISEEKIEVVHNAIDHEEALLSKMHALKRHHKIILYLGRVTLQKGLDYFIASAKKALEKRNDLIFIIAGTGDMQFQLMRQAADLGISDKVLFTGSFVRGDKQKEMYALADIFVVPSVSEPFGLTPLEAMSYQIPVILSKNAGVAEIIRHCFKVDFWDTHEIANKILCILQYPALEQCMKENALHEVKRITWDAPAKKVISIYKKLLQE